MFDLSDLIAALSDAAKAADQPLLNQMPHRVLDDELKFGVASPEPATETEKTAQETATEYTPEQVGTNSHQGASDSAAAQDKARIEDWQKSVVLTIAKAKPYPPEVRKKRIEGTVRVLFTLDSYGNLLTARVQESSGASVLDNSALEVLRKIGKFPTPTTAQQQDSFTLLVPLSYGIR